MVFERYTEKARLVIFHSRKEASTLGDRDIKAIHLLLGLLQEDKALFLRLWLPEGRLEALRAACVKESRGGEAIPPSVDMALDDEVKAILSRALEEADKRYDKDIGPEHFLLASLQVPGKAKDILHEHGITYKKVSARLRDNPPLGDALDYT
jgi:ATP-dependent Clp protease ATP-binding subunit ClpA